MSGKTATERLREMLDERGVEWQETINHANCVFTWWESPIFGMVHAMDNEDGETLFMACLNNIDFTPEQAVTATLGNQIDADLRKAIDFMRIWIVEDAHLGESAISRELEKAEGLRKLDAIENAIAATLVGRGQMTTNRDMCSHYEPKDGVVAILREAARNLSDYHDAGEALRRLTDTTNVYHALETLADMIERDYVRRESIEEVMDNDRALVEENSMLARELLKLRAELEKATNNLNSANKDFENARAELTAERVKLRSQICKLEDDLVRTSDERGNWKANCEDWKKDCERYRSKFCKCIDYADAIHALMDDEGVA